MLGFSILNNIEAKLDPSKALSIRNLESTLVLAPRSKIIESPLRLDQIDAIAGLLIFLKGFFVFS